MDRRAASSGEGGGTFPSHLAPEGTLYMSLSVLLQVSAGGCHVGPSQTIDLGEILDR